MNVSRRSRLIVQLAGDNTDSNIPMQTESHNEIQCVWKINHWNICGVEEKDRVPVDAEEYNIFISKKNVSHVGISDIINKVVDPGGPVVSYSPLDPWFAGSNPAGVDGFFRA